MVPGTGIQYRYSGRRNFQNEVNGSTRVKSSPSEAQDTDLISGRGLRPHTCVCLCAQLCPILCDPVECSLPGSLFMGFPRQEYWSGLPFTSPGDLAERGIEPTSLALADRFFTTESPGKPKKTY